MKTLIMEGDRIKTLKRGGIAIVKCYDQNSVYIRYLNNLGFEIALSRITEYTWAEMREIFGVTII